MKFIGPVRKFHETANSLMVIPPNTAKSGHLFYSRLFTFHSLVQLLLPTFKLNGVSQPISVEYKMVHGLNQAVFKTYNFENLAIMNLSSFKLCFGTGLSCYVE